MAKAIVKARKWGNSIGVVIPVEIAKEENIKPDDEVLLEIKKAHKIEEVFGIAKIKKSAQSIKDELREGWH